MPKEEGALYFIKPIQFNSNRPYEIIADFTLNYQPAKQNPVTLHFTLNSSSPINQIDSLVFLHSEHKEQIIVITDVDQLYLERINKKQWTQRFSCTLPLDHLLKLIASQDQLSGSIYPVSMQPIEITASKKWTKLYEAVYETLKIGTSS